LTEGGEPEIAVVGSLNMDIAVNVPRLPLPGETVVGGDVLRNPGGKGGNQAVGAARLGRRVGMVGLVGDDQSGSELLAALQVDAVDTSHVGRLSGVPSGTALIAVGPDGENVILVSPGANRRLASAHVHQARGLLSAALVTLIQLEIPFEAVATAARAAGGTVVLNPAPARDVPSELLELVDVIVPNRVELAQLAGTAVPRSSEEAAATAAGLPTGAVVITLGADGALVVQGGRATHVPAVPVACVDATAAGDAFCAALADGVARGESLEAAARWAVRVSAAACRRRGAQASLPTREEALALQP
jgi:ribokinase